MIFYWPDTQMAVETFSAVRTQWRVGMNGATGIDYSAVYPLMERLGLAANDWNALFHDLRLLESEALEAMHPDTGPDAG